jgi:hypothetical protein
MITCGRCGGTLKAIQFGAPGVRAARAQAIPTRTIAANKGFFK